MATHTVNTQVAGKIVRTNEEGRRYEFFGFAKHDVDLMSHHVKNHAVIYILLNSAFKPTYVGQCSSGFTRVKTHLKEDVKEFDSVIAFTIPKHKYLDAVESAFIGSFSQFSLHNKTSGNNSTIDEFERNHINGEMELIKFMFGQTYTALMNVSQEFSLLGLMGGFITPAKNGVCAAIDETITEEIACPVVDASIGAEYNQTKFVLRFTGHTMIGAHTQGDESFEVFKGSTVRYEPLANFFAMKSLVTLRANLIAQGVLVHNTETNQYVFADDFVFNSLSQAACICNAATIAAPTRVKVLGNESMTHREYFETLGRTK